MPNKGDTLDLELARIAGSQYGIVTAKQLAALGLGRPAISERVARGREGGRGGRLLVTQRHNIPVTTVARTIADLLRTSLLPPRLLRRAIRQAEQKGHRLDGIETDRTRSDLETLFLEICRRHALPTPEVNVNVGAWEVDFLWRPQRLVVETDFWSYHRSSVAFEDDHARDLDLRAAGYTVLRFTDKQLDRQPASVVEDLRRSLGLVA